MLGRWGSSWDHPQTFKIRGVFGVDPLLGRCSQRIDGKDIIEAEMPVELVGNILVWLGGTHADVKAT